MQADAEQIDLAAEDGQEVDALRPRADEEDQRLLQEEAHREGRDEQRRRIGVAERPEGDALGDQRQHDRRDEAGDERDRQRRAEEGEQGVAGDHDQLAMGEVDQPHDAEDQPDAEGGEGIEAADARDVGECLDEAFDHGAASRHADAEIGGVELRIRLQRRRRTVQDDGAAAHDIGAVGESEGALGVLLDEEDGDALGADAAEQGVDLVDDRRREPERGLVEHEELRPGKEGAGDGELLLLAAGKLPGRLAGGARRESETSHRSARCRRATASGVAPDGRAEGEVFRDRQAGEDVPALRDEGDPLGDHVLERDAGERLAGEGDRAGGRTARCRRSPRAATSCRRRSARRC